MRDLYIFYKQHQSQHNFEILNREDFWKVIELCSDDTYEKFSNSLRETNFNIKNNIFNLNYHEKQ